MLVALSQSNNCKRLGQVWGRLATTPPALMPITIECRYVHRIKCTFALFNHFWPRDMCLRADWFTCREGDEWHSAVSAQGNSSTYPREVTTCHLHVPGSRLSESVTARFSLRSLGALSLNLTQLAFFLSSSALLCFHINLKKRIDRACSSHNSSKNAISHPFDMVSHLSRRHRHSIIELDETDCAQG